MGLESIWRCEVCNTTVPQGQAMDWTNAILSPVEGVALGASPQGQSPDWLLTPGAPQGVPLLSPTQPVSKTVCPKPECLVGWANGENQRRADEKAAAEQAAKDAAEAQAKYAAEVAAQEAATQAAAAVPAPEAPAPAPA